MAVPDCGELLAGYGPLAKAAFGKHRTSAREHSRGTGPRDAPSGYTTNARTIGALERGSGACHASDGGVKRHGTYSFRAAAFRRHANRGTQPGAAMPTRSREAQRLSRGAEVEAGA